MNLHLFDASILCAKHQIQRHFATRTGQAGIAGPSINGAKRFYKRAGIKTLDRKDQVYYAVTVDNKTIKTPRRNPMEVQSRHLALAIAQEWDAQKPDIRPATMPIMTLAATALDIEAKIKTISDLAMAKEELIRETIQYLQSDTLCYQLANDQHDTLGKSQETKWGPVRKWFMNEFDGAQLDVSYGTLHPLKHDEKVISRVKEALKSLSILELVCLRSITKECKSFLAAYALYRRHLSSIDAMELARLEEETQIERWGLVEGGHDLDRVNCSVRVACASTVLWAINP